MKLKDLNKDWINCPFIFINDIYLVLDGLPVPVYVLKKIDYGTNNFVNLICVDMYTYEKHQFTSEDHLFNHEIKFVRIPSTGGKNYN